MVDSGHEDLTVYQFSQEFVEAIVEAVDDLSQEEDQFIIQRILKSAKNIPLYIVQAMDGRGDAEKFANTITEAIGETVEVEVWLAVAKKEGQLLKEDCEDFSRDCEEISRLLYRLLNQADGLNM
ncbi:MAG: four helix bundle protein [Candidatus Omnitrophica bacterium]|nr:four helix bundle protein [Candidatus Omnitrophota bacterium]